MRGNQLVHARAEPADSRGNRAQLFARRALERRWLQAAATLVAAMLPPPA